MDHISNICKVNYYIDEPAFPGYHIVAHFDAYGYQLGLTIDGLIKPIAKIEIIDEDTGFGIADHEISNDSIPKEVFSYDSHHGDKWKRILKLAYSTQK